MRGVDEEEIAVFNDSLARCRLTDFLERFYRLFLASSAEVAEKFEGTDFRRQRLMVARALYLLIGVASGDPAIEELEPIANVHGPAGRNIQPELYDLWLECLLRAVRECDPFFNRKIEHAWRTMLRFGIEFMKSRAVEPLPVAMDKLTHQAEE